jgi:hypothetical protein
VIHTSEPVIQAVLHVLPNLHVSANTLIELGKAYCRRRGYRFLAVSQDWTEIDWLLGTGRAQAVVLTSPHQAADFVGANTGAIMKAGRRSTSRTSCTSRDTVKAVGSSPVPSPSGPARAVILVPPGQLDPHGARCAQQAEQQGLEVAAVVQTLDAAVKTLYDRDATVLLVATEDHLRDPDGLRIEIVSLQPTIAGARRSRIIRRQ